MKIRIRKINNVYMNMMRNFKVKDSVLLELSDTIRARFTEDLALFTAFDAELNQAFAAQLQTNTNLALAEGGDFTNRAKLTGKTVTVNEAMTACNQYHKQLTYWINKAFDNNIAVQKQFGIGTMTAVAKNQPKMIVFMENLVMTIAEYRTALEGVGAPAALLNEATGLAENLRTSNTAQEQLKGSRIVDTAERISLLNSIYSQLQQISKVAAYIFVDTPEKQKLYQLPRSVATTPPSDDTTDTSTDA